MPTEYGEKNKKNILKHGRPFRAQGGIELLSMKPRSSGAMSKIWSSGHFRDFALAAFKTVLAYSP